MRYCSLSTRAYDTLHYGLVFFFTMLSPVFAHETGIRLPIIISTSVFSVGDAIFVWSWTNKAGTEGRKTSTPVPLTPSPNMFGTQALLAALSTPFKRSQLGLFHGKMRQSGNNVPFSKHKTKRTWLPNVQQKRLHSDTLGENVKLKITTRALKTIKKVGYCSCITSRFLTGSVPVQYGGLDNYLLNTKTDLLGQEGMRLRVLIREQRNLNVLENTKEVPRAP